ncbi:MULTISPECIES: penicillin acylase family protein [unclassified Spirosoma]|uniref:penicillin acylase family protein n=1 Tax=unclassified Spirosoma TaxID=2621999 RepID=UPI00095F9FFC|nr:MULTISPECIES: penicillin acylase family protein [unclassified Spirosoma]MBN8826273.1 penicillin acylase family protein [Spirosoma sp.]OJW75176.1 MAG: penicillin acylase family protein [Spirosoma sp. 48-14]
MLLRFTLFLLFVSIGCVRQSDKVRQLPGLQEPVDIVRDKWGVNHIYAKNEHDLFFAQGYSAAQDRLFQLEMWRRQATGTTAELLGPQELKRDIGARLFRFRGNLDDELRQYHPHGPQIVRAFVDGINAYINTILKTPDQLPFEFQVLRTKPGLWTPEVVVSRHQGIMANVRDELNYGRLVHLLGPDKVRALQWFHPTSKPNEPDLTLHVNGDELFQPILELYEAFRLPLKYKGVLSKADEDEALQFDSGRWFDTEKQYTGSNNWVISGAKSASGFPMLANDPHRSQATPSLRYWVHLDAPGWHVVGAGEPTLPGISIGHNEYGAWGLTIFETDNEDLYVYETNPANPNQYRYKGAWVDMKTLTETIPVKGGKPVNAILKYTQHGPVVFDDTVHHKVYAVRAGWLEPGCAPYLASLRMNQARNWAEFRQACLQSRVPGENMIWAERPVDGKAGNIGWQVVALSPVRPNYTGLVPVPGDGRFEWNDYLPIQQLPNALNPPEGYIVTANNNLLPPDYPYRNAVGWTWASPSRADRIKEVLNDGEPKSLNDFKALQADYLSIPARMIVPLLQQSTSANPQTQRALTYLRRWDYRLDPNSIAATIFIAWDDALKAAVYEEKVPAKARPYLKSLPTSRVTEALLQPGSHRDSLLIRCLDKAVTGLTEQLGPNMASWQYGQPKFKHITITHPLSGLVDKGMQKRINLGPMARGGYGETVNATSFDLNQTHGASFRILVDTQDWDKTLGINTPGQSGNPDSPHYSDLFPIWAKNDYFPVYFSKDKVNSVSEAKVVLKP